MAQRGLINPKMKDEQRTLKKAFEKTRSGVIPQGKNYYSLSMQEFIKNMDDQQLESVCDNFVDNWINTEKDKVMGKYNVNDKINKRNSKKEEGNGELRLKTGRSLIGNNGDRRESVNDSLLLGDMSQSEW